MPEDTDPAFEAISIVPKEAEIEGSDKLRFELEHPKVDKESEFEQPLYPK